MRVSHSGKWLIVLILGGAVAHQWLPPCGAYILGAAIACGFTIALGSEESHTHG